MADVEYKIGEELTIGVAKLKVIPFTSCLGCALYNVDCYTLSEFIGSCAPNSRKDGESVMFIDANEDKTE